MKFQFSCSVYRDSRVKLERFKRIAVLWSRFRAVTSMEDRDSLHRMHQNVGADQYILQFSTYRCQRHDIESLRTEPHNALPSLQRGS
jgi:hypothetical protein